MRCPDSKSSSSQTIVPPPGFGHGSSLSVPKLDAAGTKAQTKIGTETTVPVKVDSSETQLVAVVTEAVVTEEEEETENIGSSSSEEDTIIKDIKHRLDGLERHVQASTAVFERDRQALLDSHRKEKAGFISPPASTAAATDGSEHVLLSELDVTVIGGTTEAVGDEHGAAESKSYDNGDQAGATTQDFDGEHAAEVESADAKVTLTSEFESTQPASLPRSRAASTTPPMPRKDPAPAPIPMSASKKGHDAVTTVMGTTTNSTTTMEQMLRVLYAAVMRSIAAMEGASNVETKQEVVTIKSMVKESKELSDDLFEPTAGSGEENLIESMDACVELASRLQRVTKIALGASLPSGFVETTSFAVTSAQGGALQPPPLPASGKSSSNNERETELLAELRANEVVHKVRREAEMRVKNLEDEVRNLESAVTKKDEQVSRLAAANEEFSRTEALFQEYELYAEKQLREHELEVSKLRQSAEENNKELNSLRALAQKQAGELAELSAEAQNFRATAREQKIMAEECRNGSRHAEELRLAEGKRAQRAEEMLNATSADLLELVTAVRESVKKSNSFRLMDEEEEGAAGGGGLAFLLQDDDVGQSSTEAKGECDSNNDSAPTRIRLHRTGSVSVITKKGGEGNGRGTGDGQVLGAAGHALVKATAEGAEDGAEYVVVIEFEEVAGSHL